MKEARQIDLKEFNQLLHDKMLRPLRHDEVIDMDGHIELIENPETGYQFVKATIH